MGWSRLRLRRRASYSDVSAVSEEKPFQARDARTTSAHGTTGLDQSFVSSDSAASSASSATSSAESSPNEGGKRTSKFKNTMERLHPSSSDQCKKMLITGRNRGRCYGTF